MFNKWFEKLIGTILVLFLISLMTLTLASFTLATTTFHEKNLSFVLINGQTLEISKTNGIPVNLICQSKSYFDLRKDETIELYGKPETPPQYWSTPTYFFAEKATMPEGKWEITSIDPVQISVVSAGYHSIITSNINEGKLVAILCAIFCIGLIYYTVLVVTQKPTKSSTPNTIKNDT